MAHDETSDAVQSSGALTPACPVRQGARTKKGWRLPATPIRETEPCGAAYQVKLVPSAKTCAVSLFLNAESGPLLAPETKLKPFCFRCTNA